MSDIAIHLEGVINWMTWLSCGGISLLIILYIFIRRGLTKQHIHRLIYFSLLMLLSCLLAYLPFILYKIFPHIAILIWSDYLSPFMSLAFIVIGLVWKFQRKTSS